MLTSARLRRKHLWVVFGCDFFRTIPWMHFSSDCVTRSCAQITAFKMKTFRLMDLMDLCGDLYGRDFGTCAVEGQTGIIILPGQLNQVNNTSTSTYRSTCSSIHFSKNIVKKGLSFMDRYHEHDPDLSVYAPCIFSSSPSLSASSSHSSNSSSASAFSGTGPSTHSNSFTNSLA